MVRERTEVGAHHVFNHSVPNFESTPLGGEGGVVETCLILVSVFEGNLRAKDGVETIDDRAYHWPLGTGPVDTSPTSRLACVQFIDTNGEHKGFAIFISNETFG